MQRHKRYSAIIFDMDGVLIDAKDWHYEALNSALSLFGYEISRGDHLARFDGLTTNSKLRILSEESGLPTSLHGLINEIKQERTLRLAAQYCYPKPNLLTIFSHLRREVYKIGLATNSIKKTTYAMMGYAGLLEEFDAILTNQDVLEPKPSPQIYLKACEQLGVSPKKSLVFEDNQHGIQAARDAGCQVFKVSEPDSLFLDDVILALES